MVSIAEADDETSGVTVPSDFGFIDVSGKFIIEPKFREARNFHDGRAFVTQKMAGPVSSTKQGEW